MPTLRTSCAEHEVPRLWHGRWIPNRGQCLALIETSPGVLACLTINVRNLPQLNQIIQISRLKRRAKSHQTKWQSACGRPLSGRKFDIRFPLSFSIDFPSLFEQNYWAQAKVAKEKPHETGGLLQWSASCQAHNPFKASSAASRAGRKRSRKSRKQSNHGWSESESLQTEQVSQQTKF